MENLLRNDFIAHYGLPACTINDLTIVTRHPYFEIEDLDTKEISLHTVRGAGMAKFVNPNLLQLSVINYDKFITSLPPIFVNGIKRSDILITCDSDKYFVLGELKDRNIAVSKRARDVRRKAKKQLLQSLKTLRDVPNILSYINTKAIKRCCYFNKQSQSPPMINAVTAFNRLPSSFPDGFKMPHSDIEGLNFDFWEYTGNQTFTMI